MAYEKQKQVEVITEGLDSFVESRLTNLSRQMTIRNAEDESNFSRAVLENDISLDEQLSYRQEQLKRVTDDPSERKRIRLEVASLKDRIQMKKFTDDYTSKLIEFERGVTSIDNVITWLNNQKTGTSDMTIKSSIDKVLVEHEKAKFTIQRNALENQTRFAANDKTESVIADQMTRVTKAKNDALLAGNEELISSFDLQIQSLNKALNENKIERDIQNFSIATLSGNSSAVKMLDEFNTKINTAGASGSIKIGDTTFSSPREFWTYKRDAYIADEGPNGLFGRLKEEKTTALSVKQSQNMLSNAAITSATADFDALLARPELQSYAYKVGIYKQDVLQTGVNLRSTEVYNRYLADLDVNKALTDLNTLKGMGANVEDAYTKIVNDAAKTKTAQVSGIVQATQEILKNKPGMNAADAVAEAVRSGAGVVVSPEQAVTKDEKTIATDLVQGGKNQTFTPDPRTTAPVGTTPTPASAPPPSIVPTQGIKDLASRFGKPKGAQTIYDKTTGLPVQQAEFFKLAGVNSFENIKLDDAYTPFYKYDDNPTVFNRVTNQGLDYNTFVAQAGGANFGSEFVEVRKRTK